MRRTYAINGMALTIAFTGDVWVAKLEGPCVVTCQYGEEHTYDIDCTVHMDAQRCTQDLALLNAYEWAIRGKQDHAHRVAALILDDEMYRLFFDPCEVDR